MDEMRWSPFIECLWIARVPADHTWRSITGAYEMKQMNEMGVEKLWNELCERGKREKPLEKPTQTPFRQRRNQYGVTETRTRNLWGRRGASNRLCHESSPGIIYSLNFSNSKLVADYISRTNSYLCEESSNKQFHVKKIKQTANSINALRSSPAIFFLEIGHHTIKLCFEHNLRDICATVCRIYIIIFIIIECFDQGQVLHCKRRNLGCSSAEVRCLPQQTQEPRLQFFQGLNRCGSFPLLSTAYIYRLYTVENWQV